MSPNKIRKTLHRRLAFLEASLEHDPPGHAREFLEEESGALRSVMTFCNMLDEDLLKRRKAAVVEKVLPQIRARRARHDRQDFVPTPPPSSELMLADHAELLVTRVIRETKVA